MDAAATLRRARAEAGLSQRALAGRAETPQPAIARIEQGRVTPRLDTFSHLLAACDRALEVVQRVGAGIDRSVIRELLKLSPRARLELAVAEAANLQRFMESAGE